MRKYLLVLLAVIFLVGWSKAPITSSRPFLRTASTNDYNLLEGVALNAAAATRTITLATEDKFSKLRVLVFFTHSAATTVTAELSCSIDGTNYAKLQSRKIASGTAALSDVVDTKSVSGNVAIMIEFDIRGCQSTKVLFGGAGAGAGDLVDVQATAIAGN